MQSQNIPSKLEQIKSFILPKLVAEFSRIRIIQNNRQQLNEASITDCSSIIPQLFKVQTVGAMWRLLIESDSEFGEEFVIDMILKLFAEGIQPTYEEMAECDEFNRNAWFLIMNKGNDNINMVLVSSFPWMRKIFGEIVNYKVVPLSEDLNRICTLTNTSGWYLLSHRQYNYYFYQFLIEGNQIPSEFALNAISNVDNASVWFNLFERITRYAINIIDFLLQKQLYPNSETLSHRITTGENCWYILFLNQQNYKYSYQILAKGIFPKQEDLDRIQEIDSNENIANVNIWCFVLRNMNLQMVNDDDENNVVASKECNYFQANEEDREILNILLDNNIFPSFDHYKNFLQPKMNKLADPHPVIAKLNNRIECSNVLKTKYCNDNELFVNVFSRHDVSDFYGFVYLFYLMTIRTNSEFNFPLEIWAHITTNFPIAFSDISSSTSRNTFLKVYHQTDSGNLFFKPPFLVAKDQSNLDTNKRKAGAENSEQPLKKQKRS